MSLNKKGPRGPLARTIPAVQPPPPPQATRTSIAKHPAQRPSPTAELAPSPKPGRPHPVRHQQDSQLPPQATSATEPLPRGRPSAAAPVYPSHSRSAPKKKPPATPKAPDWALIYDCNIHLKKTDHIALYANLDKLSTGFVFELGQGAGVYLSFSPDAFAGRSVLEVISGGTRS